MIYQYLSPSPVLREFVRDYLIAHFVFGKDQPIPVKAFAPRPEQAMAFLPRGGLVMHNAISADRHTAPATSICGQQLSRYNFHLTREYLMFRINFHPGALFRLLKIPLNEFSDTWFNADSALGQETSEVNERLANASSYKQMIDIVEDFLIKKIRHINISGHPLDKAVSYLLNHSGKTSVDWLADQACLSPRQFNRKFVERIGVGPKIFSRIVRFFNAYKFKEAHPNIDWLSVAVMFGYTDYQHLAKDFKEFSFATPNLWVHQDTHSPERLLRLTAS
jgi:AraC-like DNA-binding protein